MHANTYTREIHVTMPNEKGIEVLLKIQAIFTDWGKSAATILTVSGIVATLLFFWSLDTVTCMYEQLFPPPMPPIGHVMRVYRITQHILSFAALSLLTWLIHTMLDCFFLTPKKEGFQKELESLLTQYPGFLDAIKGLDLDLHIKIIGFLPAESEHFAR